jgi:hypothetical protein
MLVLYPGRMMHEDINTWKLAWRNSGSSKIVCVHCFMISSYLAFVYSERLVIYIKRLVQLFF